MSLLDVLHIIFDAVHVLLHLLEAYICILTQLLKSIICTFSFLVSSEKRVSSSGHVGDLLIDKSCSAVITCAAWVTCTHDVLRAMG